ncbi:DUF1565 domain-containing protein, partial [Klebsiella pneumoniae]|uniref:DUF1565 domain-containing protein n=1 Tax=Klebsiella pneumoniae TaxID=573 RepID=UPI003EE1EC6D
MGVDSDPGTATAPKRTIAAAVTAAGETPPYAVFVATGRYAEETLELASGVMVYGGFDAGWRPTETGETELVADPVAVR